MVKTVLILALIFLGFVLLFSGLALARLRRFMSEDVNGNKQLVSASHPQRAFSEYKRLHPGGILNKCYVFLSISMILAGLGLGAVSYCFGQLSAM